MIHAGIAINITINAITIILKKPSRKPELTKESFAIVSNLLQYKEICSKSL